MCEFHEICGCILYTLNSQSLTLKASITASHLLTSFAEIFFKLLAMTNSVHPDQTDPASILIWGPTLFLYLCKPISRYFCGRFKG